MVKLLLVILSCLFSDALSELSPPLDQLKWLIGTWKSEYGGKIIWPTVPTMTYGEIMTITEAPYSQESGVRFLHVNARSWSHSTKDRFLDMYGYLTVDRTGNATLLTTGNNGYSTLERGRAGYGLIHLELKEVGRVSVVREIPVIGLQRDFRLIDDLYLEQSILMRTTEHPHTGVLEHARILYEKIE